MRYISLGLGRSDHESQGWAIGVGLVKAMDQRGLSDASPAMDQAHLQQPPAYKPLYKLQGLGDGPGPSLTSALLAGELDG